MGRSQKAAVLYHYPCSDGAFAALAAHLYYSAVGKPVVFYPNRVYDPIKMEDLPTEDFEVIYLLDFVGPDGFIDTLSTKAKSVVILDHHMTTRERLLANKYHHANVTKVIDMNKSGATIAYDFFAEKLLLENTRSKIDEDLHKKRSLVQEKDMQRISLLFKYIEDADLWRWALPDSKAFSNGLKDMQIEYNFILNPELFKQAVNADAISYLRSELGHRLASRSLDMKLRS